MLVYLKITEEHIRKGRRKSKTESPLALALKDHGFSAVSVLPTRTVLKTLENVAMESKLHGAIKQFNKDYWAGKPLASVEGSIKFFDLAEIQRDIRIHIDSKGGIGESNYE
jgi:hypothetical protein